MEDNYPKAYKEVIEILNFVPKESVDKIPTTMIDMLKAKMDKNHSFKVDINKSFKEQDILDETKAIFANISRDYWATPYQRKIIEEKERLDRQKAEEEKRKKYDPDVFKNERINIENEKENLNIDEQHNNVPVTVKKQNIFQKLLDCIKGFLHIK